MMTRVFGAAICVLSALVIIINFFLFLNSSAHFNYNAGVKTLAQAGVFYPFFVGTITLIIGIVLVNDKVLESEEH
ncbi:MAG TPA: hypothetical protein VLZ75_14265 [Chitinophagales bacterium]|nr:hypothetical protein [Chitinophagales bacterium]